MAHNRRASDFYSYIQCLCHSFVPNDILFVLLLLVTPLLISAFHGVLDSVIDDDYFVLVRKQLTWAIV